AAAQNGDRTGGRLAERIADHARVVSTAGRRSSGRMSAAAETVPEGMECLGNIVLLKYQLLQSLAARPEHRAHHQVEIDRTQGLNLDKRVDRLRQTDVFVLIHQFDIQYKVRHRSPLQNPTINHQVRPDKTFRTCNIVLLTQLAREENPQMQEPGNSAGACGEKVAQAFCCDSFSSVIGIGQ
ncbi:MAG TPA: hypothetical protein PKY73_17885, partial [Hyphomonas sp.]|nr:hypothetical protein [Hyphomonas sp.]